MNAAINGAPTALESRVVREASAIPMSPDHMSMTAKILAFSTMCVGFFIALLDIQIVSASLRDIVTGNQAASFS